MCPWQINCTRPKLRPLRIFWPNSFDPIYILRTNKVAVLYYWLTSVLTSHQRSMHFLSLCICYATWIYWVGFHSKPLERQLIHSLEQERSLKFKSLQWSHTSLAKWFFNKLKGCEFESHRSHFNGFFSSVITGQRSTIQELSRSK